MFNLKGKPEEEEEGSLAPSSLTITQRQVSTAFIFDVSWSLYEINKHVNQLRFHENTARPKVDPKLIFNLREYLINSLIPLEKNILNNLKGWYHEQLCLDSTRMQFTRKAGRETTATDILSNKLHEILDFKLPSTLEEMFMAKGTIEETNVNRRVYTDFLFKYAASGDFEKGDIYHYLTTSGIITRLQITREWILRVSNPDIFFCFPSFAHAFLFMRIRQRAVNEPSLVFHIGEKSLDDLPCPVDLTQFDEFIFLQEEEEEEEEL